MLSQPDKNWIIYDDFVPDPSDWVIKNMPYLYLRNEVPADVIGSFDVVRKLIEHSYYESRFYEVATLKSLLTFEMALKYRFQELNPGMKMPVSLFLLIKWFETHSYFEVYNEFYLNAIREVRNRYAHPESHTYSGTVSKNLIGGIVDMINGLYENPVLTQFRVATMKSAGKLLDSLDNGLILLKDGREHLCFRAWIGFVDNKLEPAQIHFYYCLCDSISAATYATNNWAITSAIHVVVQSVSVFEDTVALQLSSMESIRIRAIDGQIYRDVYDKWVSDFPHMHQVNGSRLLIGDIIVDSFEMHLREFHAR